MAIETALRFEQISAKAYEHPADRAATSALHAVPLLDKVIKRLTDLGHERRLRQIVMGNAVRIGGDQIPGLWNDYTRNASILDLPVIPDLYVINDPQVNAMTIGAKRPIVIVNSSLVADYDDNEIRTILGPRIGSRPVGALLLHHRPAFAPSVHGGCAPEIVAARLTGAWDVSRPAGMVPGRGAVGGPCGGPGDG